MYHPTTRVLTILELLQAHQRLSGPELAERLEVSIRTVRHYITLLQDLGIPIEAERGRYGAYRLRPGFKLPPLMFTEDEALALTLGLLVARRLGLTSTAPAVEGALAKVERVMPAALRERVKAVQEALVIGDSSSPHLAPTGAIVLTFSTATQQRRRIRMRYRSLGERETERDIDPYSLVYYDGRWFGVGYCHLREGLRLFRLDRVLHAELCDDLFDRPDDFDSLAYVVHSLATSPGAWAVEVLLETTLDLARERVPATVATLEQLSDGVLLRCYVQHLDWFARFLVGLGCPMIVRHPPELREMLRKLAGEIAEMAVRRVE